jgi:hypothetical protein
MRAPATEPDEDGHAHPPPDPPNRFQCAKQGGMGSGRHQGKIPSAAAAVEAASVSQANLLRTWSSDAPCGDEAARSDASQSRFGATGTTADAMRDAAAPFSRERRARGSRGRLPAGIQYVLLNSRCLPGSRLIRFPLATSLHASAKMVCGPQLSVPRRPLRTRHPSARGWRCLTGRTGVRL